MTFIQNVRSARDRVGARARAVAGSRRPARRGAKPRRQFRPQQRRSSRRWIGAQRWGRARGRRKNIRVAARRWRLPDHAAALRSRDRVASVAGRVDSASRIARIRSRGLWLRLRPRDTDTAAHYAYPYYSFHPHFSRGLWIVGRLSGLVSLLHTTTRTRIRTISRTRIRPRIESRRVRLPALRQQRLRCADILFTRLSAVPVPQRPAIPAAAGAASFGRRATGWAAAASAA